MGFMLQYLLASLLGQPTCYIPQLSRATPQLWLIQKLLHLSKNNQGLNGLISEGFPVDKGHQPPK